MGMCVLVLIFAIISSLSGMTLNLASLDKSNFDDFKNDAGVNLIYFFRNVKEKALRYQQDQFMKQYEKSTPIVESYGVKLGKVDCDVQRIAGYCDRDKNVNKAVQVFRNGRELLALTVESLFDVDSIVSNILQVVMIRSVPIIQSVDERLQFVSDHRPTFDFLFSYHMAIGTHGHRIFMEVAHAYQNKYKFALTTEKIVVQDLRGYDSDDETAIWYIKCSAVTTDDPCPVYKYKDNMELTALARFLRVVESPLIHVLEPEEVNPFVALDLHTVFIFGNKDMNDVLDVTELLQNEFHGMVGVLRIDVDRVDAQKFGYVADHMTLPTLAFQYRDEKLMNIMPNDQDIVTFVNNHLSRVVKTLRRIQTDSNLPADVQQFDEPTEDFASEIELVETQDDQVAAAVNHLRKHKIDRRYVPALNDQTFYTETKERDLLMVLFYLQFDPRSMAMLRHYSTASYMIASHSLFPLAAVDCFDWTDVCGKVNITQYPTLRTYRAGREPVPYTGMLSPEAVVQSIHIYRTNSPIELQNIEDYELFVIGESPDYIAHFTNLSFIGLFESKASMEYDLYMKVALEREGRFMFAYATGDLAKQITEAHARMNVPMIYVQRRHDRFLPHQKFTGAWTLDILNKFIENAPLALFPELTVSNFPSYAALRKPFAILFTDSTENEAYESMAQVATQHKFDGVTLCWMDINQDVTKQLLLDYSPAASLPALAFVSHDAGTIHNYNDVAMTTNAVMSWIQAVLDNKLAPSKQLIDKEWKPMHPGYDFLSMIDKEEANKRRKPGQAEYNDEEDIGNDDEGYESDPEADEQTRMELSEELQNSRLYHSIDGRHKQGERKEGKPDTRKVDTVPQHTEL